jgi:hypothetical protein
MDAIPQQRVNAIFRIAPLFVAGFLTFPMTVTLQPPCGLRFTIVLLSSTSGFPAPRTRARVSSIAVLSHLTAAPHSGVDADRDAVTLGGGVEFQTS